MTYHNDWLSLSFRDFPVTSITFAAAFLITCTSYRLNEGNSYSPMYISVVIELTSFLGFFPQ